MPGEREDFPIARVAALARLRLSPAEDALYQAQLTQILHFVGEVAEATFDDSATGAAQGQTPVAERLDAVGRSLQPDAALANAPDVAETVRLVRVPKVIG